MSGSSPTLSATDVMDVRYYCGYPVSGSVTVQTIGLQGNSTQLDAILQGLSSEQITKVQSFFLTNLRNLEADIPGTRDNLDTSQAAVWTHNPSELPERIDLFMQLRRQLAYFLGIPCGAGVTPLAPSVFVV